MSKIFKRLLSVEIIQPETVALRLKQNKFIIDVREPHMYDKLHVKSAINIESKQLLGMDKDMLLSKLDSGADQIAVHCQLSLIRGPSCSLHLAKLLHDKLEFKNVRIGVIEGGFKKWERQYGKDSNLCEPV
ncbi:hypothetical protein HDV01_007075 [Terramyces sp. JEL0728]|nr:hypothetical protein HDV01_007075 [Terramyces sp. JEL0728]